MRHGEGEVGMRRRSWPDQAKRDFVEAWKRSGLPKTRFAVENGLSPTSFSKWIEPSTRLGRARALTRFLPVEVVPVPVLAAPLVVQVAGSGHRIEVPAGFDGDEVRRLVGALC